MADGSWIRIGAIDANLRATTVNEIIRVALRKRALSITQMPELRKEVGEAFLQAVEPFVPVGRGPTKGQLRASGRATDDGRLYWTATRGPTENSGSFNYAAIAYDENSIRWPNGKYANPTTKDPMTYPRWVTKVRPGTQEWDAFINNITPIIIRRFAADE